MNKSFFISRSKSSQSGFSLVELMIAMTLSLMLLGAVIQVFLSSKLTSELSNDVSRVQENGRFSLEFLARDIRMAGYSNLPRHRSTPNILNTSCDSFNPCTSNGAGNNSDRIAVTLNPLPDATGAETDCTGANVNANDQIANVYYVSTDNATGISSLMCRGYNLTTNTWNASEQPLVDGIDNMQILYGIDSTEDDRNLSQVNRFVDASSVSAADWNSIRAVRLALLASSGTQNGAAEDKMRSYALLDAPQIDITDKHVRQVYTATINITNVN